MSGEFSLGKSFWRSFTARHWNRRPTVLRAPFTRPLVHPSELFHGAIAAATRLREPTDDVSLVLGTRRVVERAELRSLLPRSKDGSLHGYLERIKGVQGGRELAMFVSNFQQELGWAIFGRFCQFLGGLYAFAGAPGLRAEVDLFMGNYRRTGAGVHRDSADVFCFVVEGRKRIRAWPARAISCCSPRSGPSPYSHLLGRSILLEGNPGDILYWPSSYWHVAESDGQPGSSLSLGLYYGGSLGGALADALEIRGKELFGRSAGMESLPFNAPPLDPSLASGVCRIHQAADLFSEAVLRHWMDLLSGYGFVRFPPARHMPGVPWGKSLRLARGVCLLWHASHRGLVISVNGRSEAVAEDQRVTELLRGLRSGRQIPVNSLRSAGTRKGSSVLRRTLEFLWEAQALKSR